ncbi:MAG: zf-HC2 domain-containing protein [Ignavibacteriales bacterium]|nr:zf-HC2 domain-containing protein [Ignavibacteriales bacterium]
MPTEHINYLLPDYLTGRLESDLREGVEAHLKECKECVSEMANLREVLGKVAYDKPYIPSTAYFSALLPRIRQRLDGKQKRSLWAHPVFVRIVSPLAVAVLAIVMLSRVPFPAERQDPLKSIVADVSTDELEQVVLEQSQHQPGGTLLAENELASLPTGKALENHIKTIGAQTTTWIESESIPSGVVPRTVNDLDDSELEMLLQRLGERTVL